MRYIGFGLLVLVLVWCASCAGELGDPEPFLEARAQTGATVGADVSEDVAGEDAPTQDTDPGEDVEDRPDGGEGDVGGGEDAGASDADAGPQDPCDPVGQTGAQLVAQRCSSQFCHSTQSKAGNLDLESPGLVARLVDVNAQGCPDRALISSSDTTGQSYLLQKVLPAPHCEGSPMPLGDDALNSDEVQCFTSWIEGLVEQHNTGE